MQNEPLLYFFVVGIFGFVILGHVIHEFAHWLVGFIFGSGPKPIWKEIFGRKIPWPRGITHTNLEKVSNRTIRISGFTPLFWLVIHFLTLILILSKIIPVGPLPLEIQILVVSTLFGAAVELSESDVTALFDPEKFRIETKNDNYSYNWGWPILFRKLAIWLFRSE